MLALMLAGVSAQARPTVTTLGGGNPNINPKYKGYRNGPTLTAPGCGAAVTDSRGTRSAVTVR